jgi:hypothetical protein
MIDPDEPIPGGAAVLLAAALRAEPESIQTVDITYEHRWVRCHRIVVAYNDAEEMAAVAVPETGAPRLLTGDLAALSALLVAELGAIPGGLSPIELAEAFRRLTSAHPMGRVGEPVLLRMGTYPQPGYLDDNLRAQDEAGRRFSAPPSLVDLGGGQFRLEFHYWTNEGGVELWHLEGNPSALTRAQGWNSAAPGSFQWPFG